MYTPAPDRPGGLQVRNARSCARLLYRSAMSTVNLHELAEERSIAMHAAVADRLRADPSLLDAVRGRIEGWLRDGSVHAEYARAWAEIVARPLPEILRMLTDRGERARALRQVTPFTGILDQRERLRIRAEIRERLGA